MFGKALFAVMLLAACSTNPATGEQQFTALMSPQQEASVGAAEHEKVIKMFGAPLPGDPLQVYVNKVGRRVAANTERADVAYKFYVLDTPMVNAFALPGGYVYVSRGLLAQANSEAELAGVLGHEVGHITGRHSAERYSHGMLATLGAIAVAAATNSGEAARAAGVGSDLYIKSYSRGQEHQADDLGIRYLHRAGYDTMAMADFLQSLGAQTDLDARLEGKNGGSAFNYFSTHPRTEERISQAIAVSAQYPKGQAEAGRDAYLSVIDGMMYGDSTKQGLVRGQSFYHPGMDFTFIAPQGFTIHNQPENVVATSKSGGVIVFDAVGNKSGLDPAGYIAQTWLKEQPAADMESIEINGRRAATASFAGTVSGQPMTIRLVAVAWGPDRFFRFQMAYPRGADAGMVEDLKRATYSLRPMTAAEKRDIQPWKLRIVTAKAGDTASSLAARMPFETAREDRFRVLNGMKPGEQVQAGKKYKIISG